MIEILSTGYLNSVQDLGREGHLHIGVSRGGAMDPLALEVGNLMVGNSPNSAGIEVAVFPFRLRFHADAAFAITGAICETTLDDVALPPWWATTASTGRTLTVSAPRYGARAYVCFAGGVDVPSVLGSRGTDQKAGFGGLEGRGLVRGDRLALSSVGSYGPSRPGGFGLWDHSFEGAGGETLRLRVIPGPEFPDFEDDSQGRFFETVWTIGAENNRIGCRLTGEPLLLRRKRELFSHGIVPGTVQVPPSGFPIVQMADANTCGGYPKIANLVPIDLRKLAQASTGTRVSFVRMSVADASRATASERAEISKLLKDTSVGLAFRAP